MALTNLAVAEEALSLSPAERVDLARLLIQSLENDRRTDAASLCARQTSKGVLDLALT